MIYKKQVRLTNVARQVRLLKTIDFLVANRYNKKRALELVIKSFGLTREQACWLIERVNKS